MSVVRSDELLEELCEAFVVDLKVPLRICIYRFELPVSVDRIRGKYWTCVGHSSFLHNGKHYFTTGNIQETQILDRL